MEQPRSAAASDQDTLALFQPKKQVRTFEEVIAQIRAVLAEGKLGPGDKLPPERDLAARLSVSRNSVREALRTLEIGGVIELRRGARGGAFILDPEGDRSIGMLGRSLKFTDVSVADITQAMRALTMMLLDASMPSMDASGIEALEANIAEAAATSDRAERSAVIIRFYLLLAQSTGNPILVELAESLCAILQSWVQRLGSLDSDHVLDARREIVKHIRGRDVDAAKRELDRYLSDLHELWLSGDKSR